MSRVRGIKGNKQSKKYEKWGLRNLQEKACEKRCVVLLGIAQAQSATNNEVSK